MIKMTLQQMKYAIEIARCGSMNIAAQKLFITQPSLSKALRELENELGISVFERTNRGVNVTTEGSEFLGYARQVIEQMELVEKRYHSSVPAAPHFSVSTQHYAFAVNAFVDLIHQYDVSVYKFTLRETRTHEIIEDVRNLRSEIGILYLNAFNRKVLRKIFRESQVAFTELFTARPHVFVSAVNPLTKLEKVRLADLEPYPCLSFEQGEYNSFHFSEEILSTVYHAKTIQVSDRATLFNLLIGLNGYTISTGVLSSDLNGNDIVAVPLDVDERITVGWISHKNVHLSRLAEDYLKALQASVADYRKA
jgi:DNA-binding transcriptional LysR family regulator